MADLNFTQQERRSYLIPALLAVVVLAIFLGYFYWRTPMRMADASVTHVAVFPVHTTLDSGSNLVGIGSQAQDDLYVLVTVRIDNHLHVPLFLKDFNATYTAADDSEIQTSAVEKTDLGNLAITFPALKPLETPPLLRESTIPADSRAEGMVVLHFLIPQADWDQRKSATLTIDFYHQGSMTIPIPKS
jgi:hypothetical protein